MNLHVKVAIIIAIYLCGVFCHREIDEFRLNMLIFHFGKWGDDFRYWCHFVKFTPEITYTVISDATSFEPYENHVPSNVRLLTTSLDNIKDAAIKILDIKNETKPLLNSPYKVCDYRPLFGKIFKNALEIDTGRAMGNNRQTYSHFGWMDFDLILGNILDESFFPGGYNLYMRGQYDVIQTSLFVPTNGPYTIMAYNDRTVNLYKYISFAGMKNKKGMHSYVDTLYNWRTMAVDERPFGLAIQNRTKEEELSVYSPAHILDCNENESFFWYNGKVFNIYRDFRMQQCVYFHFGGGFRGRPNPRKVFMHAALEEFFSLGYHKRHTVGVYIYRLGGDDRALYFFEYLPLETTGRLMRGGAIPFSTADMDIAATYEKMLLPFVATFKEFGIV